MVRDRLGVFGITRIWVLDKILTPEQDDSKKRQLCNAMQDISGETSPA